MKKKLHTLASLAVACLMFGACSDYLDETPNKSGSSYIYHMDQLYGLMGSLDLYTFSDPAYYAWNFVGSYMSEVEMLSDAMEYDPNFYAYGLMGLRPTLYSVYRWEGEEFLDDKAMSTTWTPSYERIFRFNTVLENLDNVEQTTVAIRNQVEGEALFGRAYYHFILLQMYCLWDEDAPGIGYRTSSLSASIPKRETVKYTLDCIYKDLDDAEAALTKAGRTEFDAERNYRPTVPTVQALRARIALYRGDYTTALSNAQKALAAHNDLKTFKDDAYYTLYPASTFYLLDQEGNVSSTVQCKRSVMLWSLGAQAVADYEELYLPSMSTGSYGQPISDWYYNLWDRENDARWIYFYNYNLPMLNASGIRTAAVINGVSQRYCLTYDVQQWLKPSSWHSYLRFLTNGPGVLLGMTTAEMYLIEAECLARSGKTTEAAEVLKTLRRTRFMNEEAADEIGGSVQEVLDERSREMGTFWRFADVKRLNGAENAGIYIRRQVMSDPLDPSTATELVIAPDDPRWAIPFSDNEAERMGWEQNPGWK